MISKKDSKLKRIIIFIVCLILVSSIALPVFAADEISPGGGYIPEGEVSVDTENNNSDNKIQLTGEDDIYDSLPDNSDVSNDLTTTTITTLLRFDYGQTVVEEEEDEDVYQASYYDISNLNGKENMFINASLNRCKALIKNMNTGESIWKEINLTSDNKMVFESGEYQIEKIHFDYPNDYEYEIEVNYNFVISPGYITDDDILINIPTNVEKISKSFYFWINCPTFLKIIIKYKVPIIVGAACLIAWVIVKKKPKDKFKVGKDYKESRKPEVENDYHI